MFGDSSPSMPSTLRCASCERRWATNSAAPLSASATADAASGQEKAKVLNKSSVMPGRLRENRLCTKAKLRSRLIRLRLEREQLARPLDALERVAPDRHEAGALGPRAASAKAEETSTSFSTERQSAAMRLVSFTAGPT